MDARGRALDRKLMRSCMLQPCSPARLRSAPNWCRTTAFALCASGFALITCLCERECPSDAINVGLSVKAVTEKALSY